MRKTAGGRVLAAVLLLGLIGSSTAEQQTIGHPELVREKHFLLRFVAELQAARHLLTRARQASGDIPEARIWFDYDELLADLELVTDGIENYLHRAGTGTPRSFRPLSGDYPESARVD